MKKFVLALAAMATLFTVSGGQDELELATTLQPIT